MAKGVICTMCRETAMLQGELYVLPSHQVVGQTTTLLLDTAGSRLATVMGGQQWAWREKKYYPNIRHKDFRSSVHYARTTPLDSETGLTGELWSKTNLLNLQN